VFVCQLRQRTSKQKELARQKNNPLDGHLIELAKGVSRDSSKRRRLSHGGGVGVGGFCIVLQLRWLSKRGLQHRIGKQTGEK
jgi:hypothetical protein